MRGLLQRWTKSSIIPISKETVWKNRKPRKRTVFLRGRQIAYLTYEQFQVTGTHDSVENYTDLFTIVLPTWYTNNFGSLELTILSRLMPTYSPLVFEMMMLRNSIGERTWTDVKPREYFNLRLWSKLIRLLLRHGSLFWNNGGAIEFLQNQRQSS